MDHNLFELMAAAISYPQDNYKELVDKCYHSLQDVSSELALGYAKFASFAKETDLKRIEEIYTATFDLQSICCLDVGYILFGEDFKRGEFLVGLARLHKDTGNECGHELADHLGNVLRLFPRITHSKEKKDLLEMILIPALERMVDKFNKDETNHNPYLHQLKTIKSIFERERNQVK
jgi:nitrate reductase assembly molybdenum cofactor insertion protein NarJ